MKEEWQYQPSENIGDEEKDFFRKVYNTLIEQNLKKEDTVLFEDENKQGWMFGFTENYIKVKHPWNPDWVNTLKIMKLTELDEDGLAMASYIKEA